MTRISEREIASLIARVAILTLTLQDTGFTGVLYAGLPFLAGCSISNVFIGYKTLVYAITVFFSGNIMHFKNNLSKNKLMACPDR